MRLRLLAPVFVTLALAGRAEVTLRYAYDVKPGPMMPPQAVEAMKNNPMANMKMVTMIKGNKAYVQMMDFTGIGNFDGALMTVLDAKNKRYATASQAEYITAFTKRSELPPEARKALEAMKTEVKSRGTGRSRTIHGIPAEEREVEMTMDLPSGPQGSLGQIRMVMSVWAPAQDAIINNPALREFAQYCDRAWVGMNPADTMGKMFAQMPGFGEKMKSLTEEFKSMRVMLGSRTSMYTPGMAAMMAKMGKQGQAPGDPNAPMMEMSMELAELSTAPIPDSQFEIPKDYQMAPLAEILESVMPKPNMSRRP